MEKLICKIRSQYGFILRHLAENRGKWFTVGDYCGGSPHAPYIGYKASARIAELQKKGLVISRWSNRKTAMGTKLKEYTLSTDVDVDEDVKNIKAVKISLPFS